MKMAAICAVAAFLAGAGGTGVSREEISVRTLPPSVVKTVPAAGDTEVDPSLKEIRVTFSKDMITRQQWSWCLYTKDTWPEMDVGGIHYLKDMRTCVAPVTLQPGRTYAIWLNTQTYTNFRDTENNPAVPYLLVFQTRK
jgi:hypothetical protein